jgi:hypothetical protein
MKRTLKASDQASFPSNFYTYVGCIIACLLPSSSASKSKIYVYIYIFFLLVKVRLRGMLSGSRSWRYVVDPSRSL